MPRWLILAGIALIGMALPTSYVFGLPLYVVAGGAASLLRLGRPPTSPAGARPLVVTFALGSIAALMAALWSPTPTAAISTAATWAMFIPVLLLAVNVVVVDGLPAVGKFLALVSPLVLAQAVSTVIFRFNPDLEANYYQSPIASVVLSGDAGALFTPEGWNNVLEIERAGGMFFVNLNRASMVMGVIMVLYVAYALLSRKRWPRMVAIVLAVAIIVGGSKTGLALLVVAPLFAVILARAELKKTAASRLGLLYTSGLAAAAGVQVFLNYADAYISASQATLGPRQLLWGAAWEATGENPFLGLGFGGWSERFLQTGLTFSVRPVHNWFLQAWLDGGLVFLAIHVALVIVVSRTLMRSLKVDDAFRHKLAMALAGAGFLWVFTHGLGDNSPILGDAQSAVPLVMLAAMMVAYKSLGQGVIHQEESVLHRSRKFAPLVTRHESGLVQ